MTAFRAYGHRIPREEEARSCEDTELVEPFAFANGTAIETHAGRFAPTGQAPIARSLEAAGDDLRERRGYTHFIFLLSDGLETCGGAPVAGAATLREEGIDVVIHMVGFDVDDEAEQQLKSVADATGGEYYSARNYDALAESVATVTEEVETASARLDVDTERNPVMGGPSVAEAVSLDPGGYTLDATLPRGEHTYFRVAPRSGQ